MGSLALLPLGYLLAGPLGEALGGAEVLVGGRGARDVRACGRRASRTRDAGQLERRQPNSATPSSGVEACA